MATIGTQRRVSMPFSVSHCAMNMASCKLYDEKMAAISSKQEHQRMVKDPRSKSETNSYKPTWWFLLNRTGQAAAMRKIDVLYKTTPGLTWEEKWLVTEAALRESRMKQMAGVDEAILHMRYFLVYDGDNPLPDRFADCFTDDDRLNALLARPSPYARMALDTFSRRTASSQSIASSSGTQDFTIDTQKPSETDGEKFEEFAEATRTARLEVENRAECESEETGELDEEDAIWEGLVNSCGLNYGTFC